MPHHPSDLLDYFFVLFGTARNTAVTSYLTHIIPHLQQSSTTCLQYLWCAFQHIYTTSAIWPCLSIWCYCVTVKHNNILNLSLMKKKIWFFLYIYCGCNSQGSLSVETWGVLSEWAGVQLDLAEVETLSVIKDLEKVTHGKSWEFTFEWWRLQKSRCWRGFFSYLCFYETEEEKWWRKKGFHEWVNWLHRSSLNLRVLVSPTTKVQQNILSAF